MAKKGSSKFEIKMLEKLDEIAERLTLLVELNVPPLNIEGLKLGKVEKEVLSLCNLKHTTKDMSSKLRKKPGHIRKTLTGLRKKGLIRSVEIRGETYYMREKR